MRWSLVLALFLSNACLDASKEAQEEEEDDDNDDEEERREGDRQGDCQDQIDNDNDGWIDCEDQDCVDKPACEENDTATDTSEPDQTESSPVAICDVAPNPVTPPFTPATFDGSGSYDPNGNEIVMYYWELIEGPAGSAATLPYQSGIQVTDFYADLAGEYIGELTITNDLGLSNSCQASLEATPSQSLWIEMFWQQSGDDMDLHLLAPNGTLESDQDCYYANCTWGGLDWGQAGVSQDDPNLDIDDISGTGPENINIYSPQTDGVYTVYVHDYPGSTYDAANDVTVNIYLNGSMVWSDTRSISGEDSYTQFASIDWSTQTVTGL